MLFQDTGMSIILKVKTNWVFALFDSYVHAEDFFLILNQHFGNGKIGYDEKC